MQGNLTIHELVAENRRLQAENVSLREQVIMLTQRMEDLERKLAQALKNSSNSSKPPSSDIVKPPKESKDHKRRKKKRTIGGQPGHPPHQRKAFAPGEIDETKPYTLAACPVCGGALAECPLADAHVVQQVELVEKPLRITEHQGLTYWCEHCQCLHTAPLPPEVERGGLFGPRLTAQVAYLKGACHTSFSTIQKYLDEVLGLQVSRGYLCKVIGKMSAALKAPYAALLTQAPLEPRLNVDETGHKENRQQYWTWCFRASRFGLFVISPTRSTQVLEEVLGQAFEGVLGCDFYGAYRKYMSTYGVLAQFCLAHLIRELKYLTTLSDPSTVAHGNLLLDLMREVFGYVHRRERMSARAFEDAMESVRGRFLVCATVGVPDNREAQNLAKRLQRYGDAYFRFMTIPGLEPTNNLAEQILRFVVLDRKVTQGTRSLQGRCWSERIWSTVATCAIQHRRVFDFLTQAIQAHFTGQPAPSLL